MTFHEVFNHRLSRWSVTKRRAILRTTGVAIAGSTAGCLDTVPFLGNEPVEFEATPASVPDSVLQDTGYEERKQEDVVIERTFEAGSRTQDVVVTNWQTEYDRAVDLAEARIPVDRRLQAAIFTVLTTPQVDVLGRSFNPVADMDSDELAETVQDRYEGIDDIQRVGEREAPLAGRSTTVGEFEAEAELIEAGATVDLTLHIAEAVESGDDLIVGVGGYPRILGDRETENVFTLMDAVEHDG